MNIQAKGLRIENLKRETWKDLFFITITLTLVSSVGHASTIKPVKIISPLAHQVYASDTVTSNKPSQHDEIAQYIKEVFGKDSDKAFLLLSGNSKCHGENQSFDPKATHDNGTSKDYGLFQWNDYWNGFNKEVNNERYLYDYKIATDLAYRKFVNDGYSFREWVAGECLGI